MQRAIAIGVLLLAVALPLELARASQKAYEGGKLLSVYSPEVPFPMPLPSGQTLTLSMHFGHRFEVQQGDVVYVGSCQQSEYRPE